jgi:1-phosphofructokinase
VVRHLIEQEGIEVAASEGPSANGAALLKTSDEERDGFGADPLRAVRELQRAGTGIVVVSRADKPALAAVGEDLFEVRSPRLAEVDHRGAGDSMTAAMACAMVGGESIEATLRFGAAAGALNVTRRGLGTGVKSAVLQLARQVEVRALRRPAGRPDDDNVGLHASLDDLAQRVASR